MYAATAPELAGRSGAYLQDCAVSKPWRAARDAELARKAWAASEAVIAAAVAKAGIVAGSVGGQARSEGAAGSEGGLLPPPSQRFEASA